MTTRRVHFPVQYNVCRILISPHTRKAKALIGDPSNPSNFKGARLTIQLPSSFFIALMSSPRFARFSTMTPPLPRNRSWNPKPFPPLVDPSARGVSSGLGVSMPTTEIPREIKFWAMEGQRYGIGEVCSSIVQAQTPRSMYQQDRISFQIGRDPRSDSIPRYLLSLL